MTTQSWIDIAKLLGAPLLAGLVAAFLTNYWGAWFSFRRFRKEQWWIEKRQAYDSIIRQLAEIVFKTGAEMADLETGGEVRPPALPKRDKPLTWSLQEIASAGAYIVSPKTVQAVEKAINQMAVSFVESGGNFHAELRTADHHGRQTP